jgi:murein DD-endopeptidase MepM/ murein hydrolase activator NlpD
MKKIREGFLIICFGLRVADAAAACDVRGVESAAPVLCGRATGGGILYGEVLGWDVYRGADQKEKVSADNVFVTGLGRDAGAEQKLTFCAGRNCQTYTYPIQQRVYVEQKVTVPDKFITYPDAVQKRIDRDNALIARERGDALKDNALEFMTITAPLDLSKYRISSVYGSARVFNGVPKSPHRGIDIAAPAGTPVRAAAAGRAIIVSDMYLSGNTVFIAHGHGVTTAYLHLEKMTIKTGDRVAAGAVIGTVGSTGRSSGPHLHFGVYWAQIALDPELLIK